MGGDWSFLEIVQCRTLSFCPMMTHFSRCHSHQHEKGKGSSGHADNDYGSDPPKWDPDKILIRKGSVDFNY